MRIFEQHRHYAEQTKALKWRIPKKKRRYPKYYGFRDFILCRKADTHGHVCNGYSLHFCMKYLRDRESPYSAMRFRHHRRGIALSIIFNRFLRGSKR